MNVEETLNNRGNEYGDFSAQADMSQRMEDILRTGLGWANMTNPQREAVKMIVHKLARLANGNPHSLDGWHDIQGYAKLAQDRCTITNTIVSARNENRLSGSEQTFTDRSLRDRD